MTTVNERIKAIMQALGMTNTAFADRLNVSQSFVSKIAAGRSIPSDRTISDICREFHVDEHWLRTGEGEMFVRLSLEEELAQYAAQVLTDPDREFQRQLLRIMARLDPQDWIALEEIAKKIRQEP